MEFIIGLFLERRPDLNASIFIRAVLVVWAMCVFVMALGVGLLTHDMAIGEPIAAISSIILIVDALILASFIIRHRNLGQ